nr:ABC transporter ATP-binding protein [bacterium]
MALFTLKGLSWIYEGNEALNGITCDIPENAFVAILGPNGSGKSTLLRLLSGALRPAKGQAFLQGEDISTLPAKAMGRRLAWVPQDTLLSFSFTVEELVLMGRYPYLAAFAHEDQADRDIAEQAMRQTGVLALRHRTVTSLSGGERQRAVFARALAQRTPIMLLDEPVSSLDIGHQVALLSLLRQQVKTGGFSCVCVLHDLNQALAVADICLVLREGRLIAQGPPRQVLTPELMQPLYGVPLTADNGRLWPVYPHQA